MPRPFGRTGESGLSEAIEDSASQYLSNGEKRLYPMIGGQDGPLISPG